MSSFSRAKARATQQGVPFTLTLAEWPSPDIECPVAEKPLHFSGGKSTKFSATVDRLYPERGYTEGNVAVCSQRANSLKGRRSPEMIVGLAAFRYPDDPEWQRLADWVYERREELLGEGFDVCLPDSDMKDE